MTAWAPDRMAIRASAALVGVCVLDGDGLQFQSAEFQVTNLDAVGGSTPLLNTKHPPHGSNFREGEWRATGNSSCLQSWSDSMVEVSHDYNIRFQAYDPYFFRVAFSPVMRIKLAEPLTLDQWIERWIVPVCRIVSVATNREEKVTSLTLQPMNDSEHPLSTRVQVFGTGITQKPFSSRQDAVNDAQSAFTFAADNLNLLHMINTWTAQVDDQNPLMETYDPVLLRRSQPPRSRFLVLVQALEGLAGYNTRDSFEGRQEKHLTERARVIARLEGLIEVAGIEFERTDLKFIKKNLPKRPPGGLDGTLNALFDEVGAGELLAALPKTPLIARVMSDFRKKTGDNITAVRALTIVRNDLSHGNRSYPQAELSEVSSVLERVTRAHMLRALGCSDKILGRALTPDR